MAAFINDMLLCWYGIEFDMLIVYSVYVFNADLYLFHGGFCYVITMYH